ncbi:hypothetical protein KR054_007977 [Drosophila jambulina]|nr:hypothetical protein KR054_007977 [Drosophila jambulina]
MGCPFRLVNFVLLFLTAQLDIVALIFLIKILFSHCVLGQEYGISVWLYIFFLPAITLQSVILVLFRLFCATVGLDPIAMLFNLVSGLVCIGTALTLLVSSVAHCGNKYRYMFFVSSCLGFLAGILHIINACLCNFFMPKDEWYLLIKHLF